MKKTIYALGIFSFSILFSCQSKEFKKQLTDTKAKLDLYESNIQDTELAEIKSLVKEIKSIIPSQKEIDEMKPDSLFNREKAKEFYGIFDKIENATSLTNFEAQNIAAVFYGINSTNFSSLKKTAFYWGCGPRPTANSSPKEVAEFNCCVCNKSCYINAKNECKPRIISDKVAIFCLSYELRVYLCLTNNCGKKCEWVN